MGIWLGLISRITLTICFYDMIVLSYYKLNSEGNAEILMVFYNAIYTSKHFSATYYEMCLK